MNTILPDHFRPIRRKQQGAWPYSHHTGPQRGKTCGPVITTRENTTQQNRQPQPSKDRPDPWRLTLGEAALGMALFTLLWIAGVGYLVWYEISQNTTDSMQETLHVIVTGAADVTLSAATLVVAAIVGTKTLRAMVRHLHRREETHSTRDRRT